MDQVLEDCMIDLAEADQAAGLKGMVGKQGEEEMPEILGRVYKLRPFGVQVGNTRGFNPSGRCSQPPFTRKLTPTTSRHRQATL